MIIRYKCFETNSSSTHALCIGKQLKYKNLNELILDYKHSFSTDNISVLTYDYLPVDNKIYKQKIRNEYFSYVKRLNKKLHKMSVKDKTYNKLLKEYNEVNEDHKNKWKNKKTYLEICEGYTEHDWYNDNILYLRRFNNCTRMFRIYETPEAKLNFIWTSLIGFMDQTIYNDERQKLCEGSELVDKFINLLTNNGFKLVPLDVDITKEDVKISKDYNKPKLLGKLNGFKYIGVETYGYYPIQELYQIINDETLFFNLVFGNSKIYTGSDEWDTFEDLDFSNYLCSFVGGSDRSKCEPYNIFSYEKPDLIGSYINGNIQTTIYKDGTRVRKLQPEEVYYEYNKFKQNIFTKPEIELMKPEFPESIDLKITNYCENNCPFCYANCNKEGKHGDTDFIKHIIEQMHPYTEIAIGGGNALSHPDLVDILKFAKYNKVICNMTLKDLDIINNSDLVIQLLKNNLVECIGISPTNIDTLQQSINITTEGRWNSYIIHLIVGIHGKEFIDQLKDKRNYLGALDKVLFLGYKEIGRGINYNSKYKKQIKENTEYLKKCIQENNLPFTGEIVSFDNLAIDQLQLQTIKDFNTLYQGKDGQFSFYIDAVKQTYAKSSLEPYSNEFIINYTTLSNILREFNN